MSSDRPKDVFNKAAAVRARTLRTNDQLKPSPPANAPTQPGVSPKGTVGTQPSRLSPDVMERNADIYRALAEKNQRKQALRQRGGLRQDFDRER